MAMACLPTISTFCKCIVLAMQCLKRSTIGIPLKTSIILFGCNKFSEILFYRMVILHTDGSTQPMGPNDFPRGHIVYRKLNGKLS